jgi:hypothetical protein
MRTGYLVKKEREQEAKEQSQHEQQQWQCCDADDGMHTPKNRLHEL